MSTDLGLDPNDPLSLLLQNSDSSMEDNGSAQSESQNPQDWSQLSSLWDGTDAANAALKAYPDLMDFSELNSLPMDMDFNPALGMEPGALHYDPLKYNPMHFSFEDAAYHNVSSEMMPPQFAFTFQQALNAGASTLGATSSTSSLSSPESSNKERRLSVTSSSSSSGASLSPVLESLSSPSSSYGSAPSPSPVKVEARQGEAPKALDPAAELAERVRQSAGVMLAVPMSADLSSQALAHSMASAGSSNRLAIPQQSRSAQPRSPISSSSSAASTPPPTTPPMNTSLANKLSMHNKPLSSSSSSSSVSTPVSAMPPLTGISGRPKTSHTTIERRYRTNLNARIQSLRMAVPALRVLEDRDGGNGKKIKKNLKDGVYLKGAGIGIDTEDGTTVDVIDERGFVDGVKVARKCSKANVLGKAVEYIRVLKKRETRLKAEQNGLKALISGLVGGPALLKDWEQRWRENFGGEERDEVEGEEEDDDSDDEDGEEDEEAVGKKRKRAKTTAPAPKKPAAERKPAAAPSGLAELAPGAPAPEKRKRGRPRKVVPPPMPVATLAPHVSHQQAAAMAQQQHQPHPDQMMHAPDHRQQAPQYMMAVFALFSFFNSPLTARYTSQGGAHQHSGMVLTPPLALAPEIVSQLVPPPAESSSRFLDISWAWKDYLQFIHLAVSVLVLGSFLWSWLGFTLRKRKEVKEVVTTPTALTPIDAKTNWSSVCDDAVLQGKSSSLSSLSLARACLTLSSKTASVSQLTSASLLFNNASGALGFAGRLKAQSLWNAAKTQSELVQTPRSTKTPVKAFEKLVMESFQLDDATKALAEASPKDKTNGESALTPIEVLGATIVKQRVKQHLGALFVEVVSLSQDEIVEQDKDESKNLEAEIGRTIDAAKELGGSIEELGCTLERVWKSSSATLLDDLHLSDVADESSEGGVDGEIRALLTALVLYKRMFSGSNTPTVSSLLISPPPSPTGARVSKEGQALLSLRKALGSRVFEDGDREGSMEDARDKVVDLIVDTERRGKGFP
ncbi:hypothetical protein BKA70DRAFT_1402659 [Coprinopsis sp. MPI-PUGE-AT-0042]|nr:hypothetical protein BKA70DRAFT_1402659 [Coprinopsis sp. MPI-PUGE-AT-0042]